MQSERLLRTVDAIGRRLHVEVEGIDRIPPGRAIFVANHGFGFWDLALFIARTHALTKRRIWSLADHLLAKIPIARGLAATGWTLDGTPANADSVLGRDELLLVLPGGLREALKPRELRYRLLWGHRYGFVRAAIRNGAPLVPLACFGADDTFDFVGNPFARAQRLHLPFPLPLPHHYLPIPRRTRFHFIIGEPIPTTGRGGEDDAPTLRSLRREVAGALGELIDDELARRAGFP